MSDIPKWAFDRAFELARERGHIDVPCSAMDAFAHYIAEHEEPPVDPVEAAVSDLLPSAPKHPLEVVIRTALKRGMELAREVQP